MTVTHRGTSNSGKNGSAAGRRRRKRWLIETYRADVDVLVLPTLRDDVYETLKPYLDKLLADPAVPTGFLGWVDEHGIRNDLADNAFTVWTVPRGLGEAACRCYRCGRLLWYCTVEVDRIVPGWRKTAKYPQGGTYVRENIRPACWECNKITGNEDRWKNHKPFRLLAELLDLIR
jgi:5-methylcytosine-specific restriction endonuclease McrA